MGKKFFAGWQLWEKLCFVLACAIVVTVLLGSMKLTYTHWRLRKYTAVAEREKRAQAIQRQMSQRRRHDEVPFGIRALESGVHIEGVWVSRPNTPEWERRESSAGSLAFQQHQSRSEDLNLEKQPRRSTDRDNSHSTMASARAPSSGFDLAVSAERLHSSHASRESSLDAAITRPPRSRHPPVSYTNFSNHLCEHRYSSTQSSLESLEAAQRASVEAIRRASTSIHHDDRSNSEDSSHSSNDVEPISAAAPKLFTQQGRRPRQPSADFDLMHSHRMSQAAETGQLTPRVRKPGQSRDSSVASMPASAEHSDYFANRQKVPCAPSSEGSSPTNPLSTPKIDALPAAVRRSSMPDVTPFAQFCQTAPPSPRPISQDGGSHIQRQSDTASTYASAQSSPVVDANRFSAQPAPASVLPPTRAVEPSNGPAEPKRTSFEKRASAVIRGHGTGFEILRPGSLNPPPPAEHPMERQRAGPPISLHNSYRVRSSSAGSAGRRLQKKRRPSLDSSTSSDSGTSRNSVF